MILFKQYHQLQQKYVKCYIYLLQKIVQKLRKTNRALKVYFTFFKNFFDLVNILYEYCDNFNLVLRTQILDSVLFFYPECWSLH